MKGIVLAGGTGSRLFPVTSGVSKQLLPVYDKPLIYYPIATLMLAGIRDIAIVTRESDQLTFKSVLGDGKQFGVNFQYFTQKAPNGIAEVFIITENFIKNEKVALVLGDNIFHGVGLGRQLESLSNVNGARLFTHSVTNPKDFGIVEFDENQKVLSIFEKPEFPLSSFAATGLYFYDKDVSEVAKTVKRSPRGELEITSVNNIYLEQGKLVATKLPRGTVWFDTGTFKSLFEATNYVKIVQESQSVQIACLEEIAWNNSWIDINLLTAAAERHHANSYGHYLSNIITSVK